jgi:hypothetical protein
MDQELMENIGLAIGKNLKSGVGRFWNIQRKSNETHEIVVRKVRVFPTEDLRGFLFIESHQLSSVTRCGRGCVVVVRKPGQAAYNLGIVIRCFPGCLTYLEWQGPYFTIDTVYQKNWVTDTYKHLLGHCLKLVHVEIDSSSEVVFVNLVHSPKHFNNCLLGMRHDILDKADGCFAFSKAGPDVVSLVTAIPMQIQEQAKKFANSVAHTLPVPEETANLQMIPKTQIGDIVVVLQPLLTSSSLVDGAVLRGGLHSTEAKLFAVPFVNQKPVGKKFALMKKGSLKLLQLRAHESSPEQFDEILLSLAVHTLDNLVVVDYNTEKPIYIASADSEVLPGRDKFNYKKIQDSHCHYLLQDTDFREVHEVFGQKIHILAAAGLFLGATLSKFTMYLAELLYAMYDYKGTMSSRPCAESIGHQTYEGRRCTSAIQENPLYGKTTLADHDYWNQSYKLAHARAAANPFINKLTYEVKKVGQALHRDHLSFLEKTLPRNRNCIQDTLGNLRILNSGILGSILFFANTFHRDKRDRLLTVHQKQYKICLEGGTGPGGGNQKAPNLSNHARVYLESWLDRFGYFDSATTCGYAEIGNKPDDCQIHQFFIMDGLGLSAKINPGVAQSFFASQFSHCTSVVVMVRNNRIYLRDNNYCLFAWGSGGRTNAQHRDMARNRLERRREREDARQPNDRLEEASAGNIFERTRQRMRIARSSS